MRRRQLLKSNKLKKWLAAPYAVWAAGFIIIPLILILYPFEFCLRCNEGKHQGTWPGSVALTP